MPCRAFSGRLGREDPDFEAGVRRLKCPAGLWKQGWSLLVRVFDVVVIIVINNKNGTAALVVPHYIVILKPFVILSPDGAKDLLFIDIRNEHLHLPWSPVAPSEVRN